MAETENGREKQRNRERKKKEQESAEAISGLKKDCPGINYMRCCPLKDITDPLSKPLRHF